MKRLRFSEEQIIAVLREQEAGMKTADICRKHGISDATFYKWKAKYGGLEVSEAKRLRTLEDENGRLKRMLADAMLDNAALKDLLGKNVWSAPSVQGSRYDDQGSCVNVSGLSRVGRCCGQAMMRSARIVPDKLGSGTRPAFLHRVYDTPIDCLVIILPEPRN